MINQYRRSVYPLLTLTLSVGVGLLSARQDDTTMLQKQLTPVSVQGVASSSQLGSGDVISLAAPEIPELDRRQLQVESDGTVSVPEVGRVQAGGLTTKQLELALETRMKSLYLDPHVSVSAVDYHSRSVAVVGAVNRPGLVQANHDTRLLDVLSISGGLREDAGSTIQISRPVAALIALPSSLKPRTVDGFSTGTVSVSDVFEGHDLTENVTVLPGDVITVPKGKLIYVVGDVYRPGGFPLGETDDLTTLKAISLAQGLRNTADASHARILRNNPSGARLEEAVNLKRLLAGKAGDVSLRPNDILFVPSSTAKKISFRALDAAITTGSGIAIWRVP